MVLNTNNNDAKLNDDKNGSDSDEIYNDTMLQLIVTLIMKNPTMARKLLQSVAFVSTGAWKNKKTSDKQNGDDGVKLPELFMSNFHIHSCFINIFYSGTVICDVV